MPKSCSLRASMPMRTAEIIAGRDGQERLSCPVIEPELPEHIAAGAWINVGQPRRLVGGHYRLLQVGRPAAEVVEVSVAARRDHALHRARVPQRKPRPVECARDAALV